MFEKTSRFLLLDEYYNIEDLFIATIAPLSINRRRDHIYKLKKGRFYAVVKGYDYDDSHNSYIDLVTKRAYPYFQNLSFYQVAYHLDEFYVIKLTTLRKYLKKSIGKISIDEIISISNRLNGVVEVSKSSDIEINDDIDTISDCFLRKIIMTSAKIDDIADLMYRETLIDELKQLAEEYVNLITNASVAKKPLCISVLKARLTCINKLIDIEDKITHYKSNEAILSNDLKKLKLHLDNCKRK